MHGKLFNSSDIKIPKRPDFLDKKIVNIVDDELRQNKILFYPNSLFDDMPFKNLNKNTTGYKILLFGILKDGRSMRVLIDDINPYFDVKIPDHIFDYEKFAKDLYFDLIMNETDKEKYIKTVCDSDKNSIRKYEYWGIRPIKYELFKGKPFKLYQEHESNYMRIYFEKMKHRKDAILYVNALGYETSNDYMSSYYRAVGSSTLISYSSWMELSDFIYIDQDPNNVIKGDYIVVSINNIKTYETLPGDPNYIIMDNSLCLSFDIETANLLDKDYNLPRPLNPNSKIFMISMVFHWVHKWDPILKICLVDCECEPNPDYLTIICKNERDIIQRFGQIISSMTPDFILAYNDIDYDWPWIIERAKFYKIYDDIVEKINPLNLSGNPANYYRSVRVKIGDGTGAYSVGHNLQIPGYIPIDVLVICKKLYPKSISYKFNFFLELNGLKQKNDMDIMEMFDLYRDIQKYKNNSQEIPVELKKKMTLVCEYCVIDAQRCQELLLTRNIIQEKRVLANQSYVSLKDTFYYADGMRVLNSVIAEANKRRIMVSSIIKNKRTGRDKFPGGLVLEPELEFCTSKLSIQERIDKAKLGFEEYSDWLNKSPEKINREFAFVEKYGPNYDEKNEEACQELKTHSISFQNMIKERTWRPVTGLDFASLYPSLIMAYNLSPEYIVLSRKNAERLKNKGHNLHEINFKVNNDQYIAWSIRHDNKIDINKPDFKFGIYCTILKRLLDNRKKIKNGEKGLKYWKEVKEKLMTLPKEEFEKPEIKNQYDIACFNYNSLNSTQLVLKVFMNTFYGVAGSPTSALYLLQLAGGVTQVGAYNITKAYNYVISQNFKVFYGDTDSLYIVAPETKFQTIDIDYYSGKISKMEYWCKMVKITFDNIVDLNKKINAVLAEDNGTNFLTMSYEEVLYPVLFTAKKKYVGRPHENEANFNDNIELFVRGIDMVRRNACPLFKNICKKILEESMSINNLFTIIEIIQRTIKEYYETDWSGKYLEFAKNDAYKEDRNNIKMHTFRARLFKERGILLDSGKRVSYVVIQKPMFKYNARGKKVDLGIGDKLELVDYAEENNLPIDLDYYMESEFINQFARFIIYDKQFNTGKTNYRDDESERLDLAKKYLTKLCSGYKWKYSIDDKVYKEIHKYSKSVVTQYIKNNLHGGTIVDILEDNIETQAQLKEFIEKKIIKIVNSKFKDYGRRFMSLRLNKFKGEAKKTEIRRLLELYTKEPSFVNIFEKNYRIRQKVLMAKLDNQLENISKIYSLHKDIVYSAAESIRKILDINDADIKTMDITKEDITKINPIDNLDQNKVKYMRYILNDFKLIYLNLMSNYACIYKIESIIKYLKGLKFVDYIPVKISENDMNDMINSSKKIFGRIMNS